VFWLCFCAKDLEIRKTSKHFTLDSPHRRRDKSPQISEKVVGRRRAGPRARHRHGVRVTSDCGDCREPKPLRCVHYVCTRRCALRWRSYPLMKNRCIRGIKRQPSMHRPLARPLDEKLRERRDDRLIAPQVGACVRRALPRWRLRWRQIRSSPPPRPPRRSTPRPPRRSWTRPPRRRRWPRWALVRSSRACQHARCLPSLQRRGGDGSRRRTCNRVQSEAIRGHQRPSRCTQEVIEEAIRRSSRGTQVAYCESSTPA